MPGVQVSSLVVIVFQQPKLNVKPALVARPYGISVFGAVRVWDYANTNDYLCTSYVNKHGISKLLIAPKHVLFNLSKAPLVISSILNESVRKYTLAFVCPQSDHGFLRIHGFRGRLEKRSVPNVNSVGRNATCLLYTSPSPRD